MRRRLLGGVLVAVVASAVLLHPTASPTLATWGDAEVGTGTATAGTVNPPTGLFCTLPGAQQWRMTWTASAAGGLPTTGYVWVIVAGGSARITKPEVTVSASTTTVTWTPAETSITSPNGSTSSGTFEVWAVDAGGWKSLLASWQIGVVRVAAGTPNARWETRCSA